MAAAGIGVARQGRRAPTPPGPAAARRAAREAEQEAEQFDVGKPVNAAAAGIGVSAARRAQNARPGQVIGHTDRGRVIVIGRDGKPISRVGETGVDKYAIPKNEIPAGWSYQWIAETVYNEPQAASMADFKQKCWTVVPEDRHPTVPHRQGGLVLVERPTAMSDEARREEIAEAKQQLKTNAEQFMPKEGVNGMQPTGRIRKGRGQSVSQDGVEPPTLEIAGDDEE
jgi:hypothetical protein